MNVTFDRLVEFIGNHWIMSSGLFIVIILLIQDFIESLTRKHKTVSPIEAVALMNDDHTLVLDVREPNEFDQGHIEGARNVPLAKLESALELEPHKQNPVIVTCQSGTRSQPACKQLLAQGFTQVFELSGGMLAWEDQKLPVTRKRGGKK
ncbi:Rhodanese-related sulfurtransferase [Methylomagnum ishizawai]|uniref:Rhodanese-related sulfurtransferase n=1 Tax=Methylomagnum ishizawai TaxID=1760988 RepID=A0A1Y6D7C6_9GAMM|nr:rhodanese-like domain-containing protein [Methylomagnum ishizawai]SMF96693.1 Rhodanese-related sulfurtransferase [Methylomagnum ishizawai]